MKLKKLKLEDIVRLVLSFIVLAIMIRQIILKEWIMTLACLLVLIVFSIPRVFDKKFKIKFPPVLEISIYLLVFASEILGEIGSYYVTVSWWDDLIHMLSGMALSAIALFVICVVDNESSHISLSIGYKLVTAFCVSMTVLTIWECIEFGNDNLFKKDMQKDRIITEITSVKVNQNNPTKSDTLKIKSIIVNNEDWIKKYGGYIDIGLYDTMFDLLDGVLGTSIYCFISYFYLVKHKKEYQEII